MKSTKKKKSSVFRYFKFSNIQTEINGYGYNYSFSRYLFGLAISFVVIFFAGKFFHLQTKYTLLIVLTYMVIFPVILTLQFKYMYEQKRFRAVVEYLEQMIYSFKKHPKILGALEEVKGLCAGKMLEKVSEAIDKIKNPNKDQDIFSEGLSSIEEEYECDRIRMLHDFLIKVERQGGEYEDTLNVILDDVKAWTERTYLFQQDRKNIKVKIIISLFASLAIAGTMTMLLTADKSLMKVFETNIYQCVTFLFILVFLLVYMLTQKILTGTWLKVSREGNKKQIDKDFNILNNFNRKKEWIKAIVVGIMCIPIIYLGISLHNSAFVFAGCILMVFTFFVPMRKPKTAQKRLMKEIEDKYPLWLRGIALNLQTENVYAAIRNSIPDAPYVLKGSIEELLNEIDKTPNKIDPYHNFLNQFDLPEIHSATKMLYSLTNGSDNSSAQINTLIKRNNALLDKSEKIKNENDVAGIGVLGLLPMLLASLKMIVDLSLMLGGVFSSMSY